MIKSIFVSCLVGLLLSLEVNPSSANSGLSYFGRPIAETCGINGCSADLSFPPCWNSTHQGDRGDKGEQGDKGPAGDKGKTGPLGEPGEKGEIGAHGAQGDIGDKGKIGKEGDKGEKGETGETGNVWQGEPGVPGDVGLPGLRGPHGPPGCEGEQGEQGARGSPGEKGPIGLSGDRGVKGAQGPKGDQGLQGRPGARGPEGPQGEKGEQGDMGEKGALGIPGIRGSHGPNGPKGPSPKIVNGKNLQGPKGPKGNTSSCPKLARLPGEKGDKGETGPKGPEGQKGQNGRPGLTGSCIYSKQLEFNKTFDIQMYGDSGPCGPPGTGTRGESGDPGKCDNSTCHCKKICTETEAIYETCLDTIICENPPPHEELHIGGRGPVGRRGPKGTTGLPGDGRRGPKGERGPQGEPWPADRMCECCPDCLKFSNTETYARHSISPLAAPACYDNDEVLYRGYSLMHFASYSPSPTVSQDLGDIGSCIPEEQGDFTAVPFQSCSSSETKCRYNERRPVVLWLSNNSDSQDGVMLNAADTANKLSRCVACRSQGGVFFVNHTLSKEPPTCPDNTELWKQRYGGLSTWSWKLRYTGLSWVMFQANDVQGGNLLQSPGSCYPGEFSSNLFYECQSPDRCFNKIGEFKNYWMMNAEEANRRFYLNTTILPTGKYRREDVYPDMEPGFLAKCAVCELVPPECTKCKMPQAPDQQLEPPTFKYVVHSQQAGGDEAVPKCSDEVDPSDDEEPKPLGTGYSLIEISDRQSGGKRLTDLGETGSCVADFESADVVKEGKTSSASKSTLWLSGRSLLGEEKFDVSDAPNDVVSRCSICASRFPVVVVHSAPDDTSDDAPSCPDSDDIVLWHGYSLQSFTRQNTRNQLSLSTSTGSCLREITDGACAVECNSEDGSCRPAKDGKCNWSLRRQHPMVEDIVKNGKLPANPGNALVFNWTPYISKCTVCAIRSA